MEEDIKQAYDIIGDIHGHADQLEALLQELGYSYGRGHYSHPEGRIAIFVGDFIDYGPDIPRVLELVRSMWNFGSALAILGNHEVNALGYHSIGIDGVPLRPHSDRAKSQHAATLKQFKGNPLAWQKALDWFARLPIYLDLEGLRVVHAAWDYRIPHFFPDGRVGREMIADINANRRSPHGKLLKRAVAGLEAPLPSGNYYVDSAGKQHSEIRVVWWKDGAGPKYADILFPPVGHVPDLEVPLGMSIPWQYAYLKHEKPAFFGHYRLDPKLMPLAPLADNVACVDYSVANGGALAAYRWDGPGALMADRFVAIDAEIKPSKIADLRPEPYSRTSAIMSERPKGYECTFIEANHISEFEDGLSSIEDRPEVRRKVVEELALRYPSKKEGKK